MSLWEYLWAWSGVTKWLFHYISLPEKLLVIE
jgi:hypothetical protein